MIVWPLHPNWRAPYRETYRYLTEILTSDSGREQRRAWRQAARRSVSYEALAHGRRYQTLRRAVAGQGSAVVFPDERTRVSLSAATAPISQTALVPSPPSWLAVGRRVVFEHPETRDREARTVGNVSGSTITFTAASQAWPLGTRIMPAFVGRMSPSIRISMATNTVAQIPIDLDVEPGTEVEMVGPPSTTLGGVEVLAHKPNWSDRVSVEVRDPTEWTDNEMGVRAPYRSVDFPTEVLQTSHLIRSEAELNQVLGLFQRSRGRCGEFYVPTWADDFALATGTAAGSSTFGVAGHDFHDAYASDPVHRAFQIRLSTGAVHRFRIASMAKSVSGAPMTLITTTSPSPTNITPENVESVSWLLMSRFASDEMTVEWITDRHATIVVNTQSTEDLS